MHGMTHEGKRRLVLPCRWKVRGLPREIGIGRHDLRIVWWNSWMVEKTGVSVERITGTRMRVNVPFVGYSWFHGISVVMTAAVTITPLRPLFTLRR